MKRRLLRRIVGQVMLIGHLLAIALAILVISDFQNALTVSATLLPVTSAVFTFVVQFHHDNFFETRLDRKIVSGDAAATTIVLSVALVLAIIGSIYLYYSGSIPTVESLQQLVGLIDSGIVAYLMVLLRRLFGS
jgi:hypothetical protein